MAHLPSAATTRRDLIVYADEFHAFTTGSVASILSELRKYRVEMVLAAHHLSQVRRGVRDSILGNVGTKVLFRLGADDARLLAPEFGPKLGAYDLMGLPNRNAYARLVIEGQPSRPVSVETLSGTLERNRPTESQNLRSRAKEDTAARRPQIRDTI